MVDIYIETIKFCLESGSLRGDKNNVRYLEKIIWRSIPLLIK